MPKNIQARLYAPLMAFMVVGFTTGCVPAPRVAAAPAAVGSAAQVQTFPGVGPPAALPSDVAFVSLEGPYWIATPGILLFSDVVEANGPGARIYKFDPESRRVSVREYPTGASGGPTSTNGLALTPDGALLACERYNGRVVRLISATRLMVLADRAPAGADGQPNQSDLAGLPFNAPNDLVVRRDGNVYFTDSDWGARPNEPHGPMAVYRLSPRGDLSRVLVLDKPNGIALSPDGATLYVGSDVQAKVWRLPVDASGATGAPTLLIDGAQVPGGFKVPDGICVDDTGRLYVTNNADDVKAIAVFDRDGRWLGRIPLPAAPSNCTFGGPDRRTMYVTTLHAIYELRMPTPGLP
jgi:gluconolactonase